MALARLSGTVAAISTRSTADPPTNSRPNALSSTGPANEIATAAAAAMAPATRTLNQKMRRNRRSFPKPRWLLSYDKLTLLTMLGKKITMIRKLFAAAKTAMASYPPG
jgi:predicted deacetylase